MILQDSKSEIRKPGPLRTEMNMSIIQVKYTNNIPPTALYCTGTANRVISFAGHAIIGLSGALAVSTKTIGALVRVYIRVNEIYVFGVVSPTLAEMG
jgi:hypothetical protein